MDEQGLLAMPTEGTLVEVAFAYGRSDKPFIRTILGEAWSLPDFKPGEQLQQQRDEVFDRIDAAGNKTDATDQKKESRAFEELQQASRYLGEFGSHEINVEQHSKENIAGQKLIETLGSFEVMASDDITLGSLANMHLVNSGDHVQIIGQLRDIVIGLNDQVIKAKNITQDADPIKLNGGTGVITCASICPFTGKPHVDGSSTVFAGK